jgi:tRNA(adenine34) deaminase
MDNTRENRTVSTAKREDEERFMREALREARKAASLGEVPIGAVVVKDGAVVGRGHNLTVTRKDPTAHAETVAIRNAAKKLGGWRLSGCDLYVTAEPCPMCAGAIVLARLRTVFIGAMDPKAGACGSLMDIPEDPRLNHNSGVVTGVLEDECRALLKSFFRNLRDASDAE